MRKLLRSMAKAKMERMGYSKVNRRMRYSQWRRVLGEWAYPDFSTGRNASARGAASPS